jgi:hypothetical protein
MRAAALALATAALCVSAGATGVASAKPMLSFSATASGFGAGAHSLTIRADGRAVARFSGGDPLRFRLPRQAVRQLRTLLARMHFARMKPYYGPRQSTDTPTYTTTYRDHTVRNESGSPPTPPRLWAFVAQLESIVDEAQHPFVVRVTRTYPQLDVVVHANRTAEVQTDDDAGTRHVTRTCLKHLRKATKRVDTRKMKPGFVSAPFKRNPPPTLEVTRAFSSFHARLDRHRPRGVTRLLHEARAAARDGHC